MSDKINEKIINIFTRKEKKAHTSAEEDQVHTTPDGFNYVHIKYDENGKHLDEEKLLEKADEQWYIIKVLEHHKDYPTIKNFKVSGERLLEFIQKFLSEDRPGKIIEIDKFYADELA